MAMFGTALLTILQPQYLIPMFVCVAIGIVLGAIPGLTGSLGMTIILPLTFGVSTNLSFAMLIGMWIGGTSGGFISATLLGIPGAPSSVATCFDAYPMTKKGEAYRALLIGIVASFIGTAASVIIAAFVTPFIAKWALSLGPWEYFSLCLCAVTVVCSLVNKNIFKGFLGAAIGLLLSTFGMSPLDGAYRFTFGIPDLTGGIDMLALMLGLYAIKQIIVDYAKGQQSLSKVDKLKTGGVSIVLKDLINNIGTVIRSFIIGLWIGFLPGMGSGLSNLVAYAQAKSAAKDGSEWGNGCPGGIWASETSNNASIGGAIIPMIALGIPGDTVTALLLSGLTIHGLQAGPLFMQNNADLAYMIFVCVLFAAILTLFIQLFGVRLFPKILSLPANYLYAIIIVMCFIGSYISTNTTFNMLMMLGLVLLGLILDYCDIPVSPLLLAYILGPQLESYFRKGISYTSDGILPFITRPISALFLIIAVLSVIVPIIRGRRKAAVAKD